jgi:hypothetical protein
MIKLASGIKADSKYQVGFSFAHPRLNHLCVIGKKCQKKVNSVGFAVEIIVEQQKLGINSVMKVGDIVRVKDSVVVYHHPEHRGQAFDLQGTEGELVAIVTQWQGRPVSANLPLLVQFSKKFKSHLRENELEIV